MNRIAPIKTITMKKVGEIRRKTLALFMSVLLAITCLPILPGSVKEAHAEAYSTSTVETYYALHSGKMEVYVGHAVYGDGSSWPGDWCWDSAIRIMSNPLSFSGSAISWYDSTGAPVSAPTGTLSAGTIMGAPASVEYSEQGYIKPCTIGSSASHTFGTMPSQNCNYTFSIGSLNASIAGTVTDFPETRTAVASSNAFPGHAANTNPNHTYKYINGTVAVRYTVTTALSGNADPVISAASYYDGDNETGGSDIYNALTFGDPVPGVSETDGVNAMSGHTSSDFNGYNGGTYNGAVTIQSDGGLSGPTADKVGIFTQTLLATDNTDSTTETATRDIVVQGLTAPDLDITYAAGATDKDGTPILTGTPYTASGDSMYSTGWTNQDLDFGLSSNDPGAYDLMLRKNGADTTMFSSVTAPPLPAVYNETDYGTQSPLTGDTFSAIQLGTGNHTVVLSPESAAKTVKIDKTIPTASATYASGTFTDTSGDTLSGIDSTRQKIAFVGSTDPAPLNAQYVDFSSGTYNQTVPGIYDVYVWAWDNAGNNVKTKAFDDLVVVSGSSPTISGKLASGPNSGNNLLSATWTNQDVKVTVTPPASITTAYSALYNGGTLENKSAAVNTTANKTYTAETAGTTLFGVMVDATNTELSNHSSNYVVMIDKTVPVGDLIYNGTPNFDFADASTDTASMVANSGVNASETIICVVPSGDPAPNKTSYVPIAGETLPATGWYDIWVIAYDNAGNESVPAKAYEHISRSGLDEIEAKDFSWDIASGSGTFNDPMAIMLGHVEGKPYNSSTPFVPTDFLVNSGQLNIIKAAIDSGLKGTSHPLTFSTPVSGTQASTTIMVTLFDSGSVAPTPPGPVAEELIYANNFNWGISTGLISPSASRALSQVAGYMVNGDAFATGDIQVNTGQLITINNAIMLGKKDTTFPLTFTTNGSTGPAASVTINVSLFDNGPAVSPSAGDEQIVGNNFAWGISTGGINDAEVFFLGRVQATSATGAPMLNSTVTVNSAQMTDLNNAISSGLQGTVWPVTVTTNGSTGNAASAVVYVTLYDAGPGVVPVAGSETVVGNNFNWGISTGSLDEPASFALSQARATAADGTDLDLTHVDVDPADLLAINGAIAAKQKGTTWPLTLRTDGSTGTPASAIVYVTLFDNGPSVMPTAGSEHIVGNNFDWGISTGNLDEVSAQVLSFVEATSALGITLDLSHVSINTAELDTINQAIAAGKKDTTWPLTFTTDGASGTPASVTVQVTLYDNGPQGPILPGSEFIVGNNFKWGVTSGAVNDAHVLHFGKIKATGADGSDLNLATVIVDPGELAALNAAIAAGKVGEVFPVTLTTAGSTGTPASTTIYVTLYDEGHSVPVPGDPHIVANHFSRPVSAGALDHDTAKAHSLVDALQATGLAGSLSDISVNAAELAAINAAIAAADITQPPFPLTFTYTCPASSQTVSATVLVSLTGDPKLEVTKTVDNKKPLPGDIITYTITAKNSGNVAMSGLWVKDNLPKGTLFVSCDAQGKYGATLAGEEYVHWYVAALAVGQEVTFTVKAKIDTCAPGTEIKNIALYDTGKSGLPTNLDDDPQGGKTNPATSVVGDPSPIKPVKKAPKTGDAVPLVALGGTVLVALGTLVIARRRSKRGDE